MGHVPRTVTLEYSSAGGISGSVRLFNGWASSAAACSQKLTFAPRLDASIAALVRVQQQISPYFNPTYTRTGWIGQPPVLDRHEVVTIDGDVDTLRQATP